MSRDHGSFSHDDGCCVSWCVHGFSSCVTKHLTDAAKRRKGLLGLRVCRVSQSQRVIGGSHRRQACIVISSGYIVSPVVTLWSQVATFYLQWSHCLSSSHIVSLAVTLCLQWFHCVCSSYTVSPMATIYLQWLHCVSSGHIVSPVVTLYLQWSHCVFSDYIVFPVVTLCHQLPRCAPK